MEQIWVIDYPPNEIKNILDEMMASAENGRGIHRIPFGCGYVSEEEENKLELWITLQLPEVPLGNVYYDYDW